MGISIKQIYQKELQKLVKIVGSVSVFEDLINRYGQINETNLLQIFYNTFSGFLVKSRRLIFKAIRKYLKQFRYLKKHY